MSEKPDYSEYLDGGKKARRSERIIAKKEAYERAVRMNAPKAAYERAKAWRERLGLSVAQLAAQTGYSPKSIYWFEQGLVPVARRHKSGSTDRHIDPQVWKRYQTCCAGVAAQIFHKQQFDW